jgi:hypothetical protein
MDANSTSTNGIVAVDAAAMDATSTDGFLAVALDALDAVPTDGVLDVALDAFFTDGVLAVAAAIDGAFFTFSTDGFGAETFFDAATFFDAFPPLDAATFFDVWGTGTIFFDVTEQGERGGHMEMVGSSRSGCCVVCATNSDHSHFLISGTNCTTSCGIRGNGRGGRPWIVSSWFFRSNAILHFMPMFCLLMLSSL